MENLGSVNSNLKRIADEIKELTFAVYKLREEMYLQSIKDK